MVSKQDFIGQENLPVSLYENAEIKGNTGSLHQLHSYSLSRDHLQWLQSTMGFCACSDDPNTPRKEKIQCLFWRWYKLTCTHSVFHCLKVTTLCPMLSTVLCENGSQISLRIRIIWGALKKSRCPDSPETSYTTLWWDSSPGILIPREG